MEDTFYKWMSEWDKVFECPCGCGGGFVRADFLACLKRAFDLADVPLMFTRGHICEKRMQKMSEGCRKGHNLGKAVHIKTDNKQLRYNVLKTLIMNDYRKLVIGKDYIHVDDA